METTTVFDGPPQLHSLRDFLITPYEKRLAHASLQNPGGRPFLDGPSYVESL